MVSGYLFVKSRRRYSIQPSKIGIKHHPLSANNPDHVLDIVTDKSDVGGAFFGHVSIIP
jgi:hypothetical protein